MGGSGKYPLNHLVLPQRHKFCSYPQVMKKFSHNDRHSGNVSLVAVGELEVDGKVH